MTGLVIGWYVSVFCKLSCLQSVVYTSDQAVKKSYVTIFFDLLGEQYVHILSVKVFVKIIDSIFVYGGECVINTTYVQTTY